MARTVGRLVVVVALVLGVIGLAPAGTSQAHRGITPTVFHDGRGSVWITVAWEDGHPLQEAVVATISGSDETGTHFGPVALRALDRSSPMTLTYGGTLTAGRWVTIVDIAAPGTGYCNAHLTVSPAGTQERVDCAGPTSTSGTDAGPPDSWVIVVVTVAVALLISAAIFRASTAGRRLATIGQGRRALPRRARFWRSRSGP